VMVLSGSVLELPSKVTGSGAAPVVGTTDTSPIGAGPDGLSARAMRVRGVAASSHQENYEDHDRPRALSNAGRASHAVPCHDAHVSKKTAESERTAPPRLLDVAASFGQGVAAKRPRMLRERPGSARLVARSGAMFWGARTRNLHQRASHVPRRFGM
jgi:hypothetical protein